jgi:hypothetical protein
MVSSGLSNLLTILDATNPEFLRSNVLKVMAVKQSG